MPENLDAFILKSVLHDWDDERSHHILKNCHQVMSNEGRLILVEIVLLPGTQSSFQYCMDLLMLTVTKDKERTLAQWTKLLNGAGFELEAIHPTSTEFFQS